MKILNLYAGIGGNRKFWDGEITAVESDAYIAKVYQEIFPDDTVVIEDAHEYLIKNFQEFDFIWSSPPCPSHSRARMSLKGYGLYCYPDMRLYEEIIFLKNFFKGKWVVENVKPYYSPLIEPSFIIDRHFFWSNFDVRNFEIQREGNVGRASVDQLSKARGITLPVWVKNQRQLLRNAVHPEIGEHIYREMNNESKT